MQAVCKTTFNEKSKTWNGAPFTSIYSKEVSIGSVALAALGRFPNKIGQINDNNGIQLTNGEIRINAIRAAQHLMKLGYGLDTIVGIYARNHHHLSSILFACLSIGAPLNTIDPTHRKDEVMHMFGATRPSVIFCELSNIDILKDSLKSLGLNSKIFLLDESNELDHYVEELFVENGTDPFFIPPKLIDNENRTAFIPCSSGSTGYSKGVCISHASFLNCLNYMNATGDDVLLTFGTYYWATSIQILISATFCNSLRILTTDTFSPELFLKIIPKYKVTHLFTPPSSLALALQHMDIGKTDLSSIQKYFVGGSKVAPQLCTEMNKYLPNGQLHIVYGCTECCECLTQTFPHCNYESIGQLTPGTELKILKENGQKCGIGEDGDLCFRRSNMFLTYYGNQAAKDEMMDNEGFVHIGDIGHVDENGFVIIDGRKKDIIKYRNYQISPGEIEEHIISIQGINNVCVVGIPDIISGDLPAALIVKDHSSAISAKDITNLLKEKLAENKQLFGGIYFLEELPMTPNGKNIRRLCKDIAISLYNKSMK